MGETLLLLLYKFLFFKSALYISNFARGNSKPKLKFILNMWTRRSAIERCRSFATAKILLYKWCTKQSWAVAEERHRSIADRQLHMFYSFICGYISCLFAVPYHSTINSQQIFMKFSFPESWNSPRVTLCQKNLEKF